MTQKSIGLVVRKRIARTNRYEYFLSPSGKALAPVLTEMGKWGMRWSNEGMTDKQNTAAGLVRDLAGERIKVDAAPMYKRHITRWLKISSFTTGNPRIAAS